MNYKKFLVLFFSFLLIFSFFNLILIQRALSQIEEEDKGENDSFLGKIPKTIERWWKERVLPAVEKNIPVIKQEFKKEVEELKSDLKKLFSVSFDFFKKLIKEIK